MSGAQASRIARLQRSSPSEADTKSDDAGSDAGSSEAGSEARSEWSGRSTHTTASEISDINHEMHYKWELIEKQAGLGTLGTFPEPANIQSAPGSIDDMVVQSR